MLTWQQAFHCSSIAFGGASLSGEGGGYGFGTMTDEDSQLIVRDAFDKGLRIFDTAPIYGFGLSEIRLGQTIRPKRDEAFIISKCGVDWDDNKNVAIRNDAKTTQRMLEASLKRLDLDTIDLYMVHWPDENVDIRKTLEVLNKAKDQGKIRYIGLCNTNEQELDLAQEVGKIDVIQNQFNLFVREPLHLFPRLSEQKIGFMSWGTLDKGIIPGTVNRKRKYSDTDVRANETPWWSDKINGPKIDFISEIQPLLKEFAVDGLALALGHNLMNYQKAQVAGVVLCGLKSEKQLDLLLKAAKVPLAKELLEELYKLLSTRNM